MLCGWQRYVVSTLILLKLLLRSTCGVLLKEEFQGIWVSVTATALYQWWSTNKLFGIHFVLEKLKIPRLLLLLLLLGNLVFTYLLSALHWYVGLLWVICLLAHNGRGILACWDTILQWWLIPRASLFLLEVGSSCDIFTSIYWVHLVRPLIKRIRSKRRCELLLPYGWAIVLIRRLFFLIEGVVLLLLLALVDTFMILR